MTDFYAKIANFIACGDYITEYDDGSWCKNIIRFEVDDYKCEIVVDPELLKSSVNKNDLEGNFIKSGEVVVYDVESLEKGEQIVADICWLLTLL